MHEPLKLSVGSATRILDGHEYEYKISGAGLVARKGVGDWKPVPHTLDDLMTWLGYPYGQD